jgi:hypothetical protein
MATSTSTSTESRALQLLGSGVNPETVASALGVSVSRISQLISDPEFSAQVAELRFTSLQKHNVRDNSYDEIEDALIEKLKDLMPLMMRPMEVLKSIQVINAAKRRGQSAPESITAQQTVVNLVMPTIITQTYAVTQNIHNQVIRAGDQDLLTIQSSSLLKRVESAGKLNESHREKEIGRT